MTSFDPAGFFSKQLARQDWLRLTKAQLMEIAEFQEIEMAESLKKMEMIDLLVKKLGCMGSETEEQKTKFELAKLEKQL